MSLISDKDLRGFLKIKENDGKWLINCISHFLRIERINQIYNENYSKSGLDFIDSVLDSLDIKYSIPEDFKTHIPQNGPFIIIANHPLGGIDGLLLLKIVCEIRPDFKMQGNFLLQRIEPIKDFILPVNPYEGFKSSYSSFKGIKSAYRHLAEGNSLGIFPAGEVSSCHLKDLKITDRQWQKSSINFIQKSGVPVIPIYFHGYNSTLFYLLGQIHPILRTAKLPSELFNKSNQTIKIEIRKPIAPRIISSFTTTESLTHYLRAKTYSINKTIKIETFFKTYRSFKDKPKKKIVEPIDIELILSDLKTMTGEHFLFSHGSFSLYCAPFGCIPNIMKEIGRLREITFREVGEGTNKSIDIDQYDIHYNHLIIWDNTRKQIAGSYRIGKGKDIMDQYGINGFYISSLFKLKEGFNSILQKSLELGRSFIVKEYQRQPLPLFLLWKGILFYLMKNPEYQYLIGPVSISNDFSRQSKSLIVEFVKDNYFDFRLSAYIKPRKEFIIPKRILKKNKIILEGIDYNIKTLDLYINEFQPALTIPVLMKKYLQMNGKVIGFNVDQKFNYCLDGLIMVNISDVPFEMVDSLAKELNGSQVNERFRNISDLKPIRKNLIYSNTSA
jgi:putative hemolysin